MSSLWGIERARDIIQQLVGVSHRRFSRVVRTLCSLIKTYLTWKSRVCKGRYQISLDRDRKEQGGNDHIDKETQHCIRNFRVTQIVCIS